MGSVIPVCNVAEHGAGTDFLSGLYFQLLRVPESASYPKTHHPVGRFGGITHAPMRVMRKLPLGSAHLDSMKMPPAAASGCWLRLLLGAGSEFVQVCTSRLCAEVTWLLGSGQEATLLSTAMHRQPMVSSEPRRSPACCLHLRLSSMNVGFS